MRTMYDDIRAANIPSDAPMVAGYGDTVPIVGAIPQWTQAEWDMFPNVPKVIIVKQATSIFGHVLDVERYDATAAEAPIWAQKMHDKYSFNPTIYTSLTNWQAVVDAFATARVPQPNYWIAHYDNVIEFPMLNGMQAVAKQYANFPKWDISCVADYWEGVDPTPPAVTTSRNEDAMLIVPAATDEHVNLVVAGYSKLYVGCSFGDTVQITSIDFWGDTGPDPLGTGVGGAVRNWQFTSNRPGPIKIPLGASTAAVRYTASHNFTLGVA